MQVINEKLVVKDSYTKVLRRLIPNEQVLVVDISERNCVSSIIARLKKDEGMEFITQKHGDKLKVQRITEDEEETVN